MQNRFSVKIVGRSGQGVNVLGEMLAKGLKRSGYFVMGYREYPSLIQGGHATYQIEISNTQILSTKQTVDLLVVLNRQGTKWHEWEMANNSLIMHDIDNPRINTEETKKLQASSSKLLYVPAFELSKDQGGNELTSNIVLLGALYRLLGLEKKVLTDILNETFKDKPKLLEIDLKCAQSGYSYEYNKVLPFPRRNLRPAEISNEDKQKLHTTPNLNESLLKFSKNLDNKDDYLLSGNELTALGAINAGVRIYYSYPMTPTSSILTFLAETMDKTGMIVKQAEDEITAAAMAIGSMHMGTRSLTATSGGGFDLMTEHISLAAITEIPFVIVLGQRPGPATGMPTWTTQGDLMLAIFSGHGEFSRCVIAAKDGEDAFYTIQEAMNIADEYQIPVIVLTDKYIAENIYQINKLDESKVEIKRGKLVTDLNKLALLQSKDRYALSEDGISLRWLPGSKAADFNANSDEHDFEGNVTEDGYLAEQMIEKRLLKEKTLLKHLPDPEVYKNKVNSIKKIKIISWGSNFGVVKDAMKELEHEGIAVENLNFKYIWPLKIEKLKEFVDENTVIIEGNYNSQLAELIKMKTGIEIKHKILKWDGRPFFVDELVDKLKSIINN